MTTRDENGCPAADVNQISILENNHDCRRWKEMEAIAMDTIYNGTTESTKINQPRTFPARQHVKRKFPKYIHKQPNEHRKMKGRDKSRNLTKPPPSEEPRILAKACKTPQIARYYGKDAEMPLYFNTYMTGCAQHELCTGTPVHRKTKKLKDKEH